jgi:iron complex transport system permease protein
VSRLLVSAILLAVTLAVFAVSLAQGEFAIPIGDVVATLVGAGPPGADFIVLELRLPRAIVGALTGAALAVSGLIFQTLVRNPLASPDIIGISVGASFAGVSVFILGASSVVLPFAAFAGALAASALLYVLAWRHGLSPYRFVLVGIGIQSLGLAGIYYMLERGKIELVAEAWAWLVGSLNGRTFGDVWPLLAGVAVVMPAVAALARSLDVLALGEETARALGVPVERARLALVVTASALAALAVAAAGPIAFVAFLAPHIARRLTRAPGAAALPAAALCGAALVLAADLAGRMLLAPDELPAGILTSILGGPFFLYLLYRTNRIRAVA